MKERLCRQPVLVLTSSFSSNSLCDEACTEQTLMDGGLVGGELVALAAGRSIQNAFRKMSARSRWIIGQVHLSWKDTYSSNIAKQATPLVIVFRWTHKGLIHQWCLAPDSSVATSTRRITSSPNSYSDRCVLHVFGSDHDSVGS